MDDMIVQIYEVQQPHEALSLIEAGVDHIGSVILEEENWKQESLKETLCATRGAGARSSLIPLYSNVDSIARALDYYRPHIVHFCEDLTSLKDCGKLIELQEKIRDRFPEIEIMRSIPIARPGKAGLVPTLALARMFEPVSDYFLTDTLLTPGGPEEATQPVDGFVGITGETCDWEMAARLVETSRIPVVLAGGISPENVAEGILRVKPFGVDSCTGTNAEDKQGRSVRFKKDLEKVRKHVAEAKEGRPVPIPGGPYKIKMR